MKCFNRLLLLATVFPLAGCDLMMQRLANVGRPPELQRVNTYSDYLERDEYVKAIDARKKDVDNAQNMKRSANSLWRSGARAFFRDQRARAIGDILKVNITVQDKAQMDNKTTKTRTSTASGGIPSLFGFEQHLRKVLPKAANPTTLYNVDSNNNSTGEGKVDRYETITTTIAAMVLKILPNQSLFIKGSQEVRVNFEVREITVEGIVRPEDISSENVVTLDQIAEARVSYGGRGQLSEYQQNKYGEQILDIISPF